MDIKRHYLNQNKKRNFQGLKTLVFNCDAKNEKERSVPILASLKAKNSLIKWDDKLYKGELILSSSPNKESCDLVMKTSMDKYISLLLTKEMNAAWPIEALKAQAVAARTYALHKMKTKNKLSLFDLENSEKNQVNGSLKDETHKTIQASIETNDLVLISNDNQLKPIFYHAECGGKTLVPSKVWGGIVNGYTEVNCDHCMNSKIKEWKKRVSINQLKKTLSKFSNDFKYSDNFTPLYSFADHSFNRTAKLYEKGQAKEFLKAKLRTNLGRSIIPSNNYKIEIFGDEAVFTGKGRGHGVGLCQMGALAMAQKGYNYTQILAHYFPNHKIVNAKDFGYY